MASALEKIQSAVANNKIMIFMKESGITHALEIGPGKVLAGLAKRCAKEIKVLSVPDAAALAQVSDFLAA